MAIIDFYEKVIGKAGKTEPEKAVDSIYFSCVATALIGVTQEINAIMHVLKERELNISSFQEWLVNKMCTQSLTAFWKLTEMHAKNLDIFSEKAGEVFQDRPELTSEEIDEVFNYMQHLSGYYIANEDPIIYRLLNERMKDILELDSV